MKKPQQKSPLQMDLKPLNRKSYQPEPMQISSDSSSSQAFIHPWQTPLGFVTEKKKSSSIRDTQKPKSSQYVSGL